MKNVIPNFARMSERINYMEFHNRNCIYMFHTTIKSKRDVPVIKIGFTNNLFERIKSLEKHYDAKFKLIGVKLCDRLSDEKLFHKMILLKYGDQFTYTGTFKKTRSTELYYYDERLLDEFENFDVETSRNFSLHIHIDKMKVDDESKPDMDCADHSSDSDYEPSSTDMDTSSDDDTEMSDSHSDEEDDEVSPDEGPSETEDDELPAKKHCGLYDRWRMDSC